MSIEIKKRQATANNYSLRYRIAKTIFMVFAWISFGMNSGLLGLALEDLKILLQTNYKDIVLSLVIRNIGYIVVTTFIGLVFDKLSGYSDLLMAFAKLMMISSELISVLSFTIKNY
jgi:hypothetical protein